MPTRLLAIALIAGFLAACTGSNGDPKPSPSPTSQPPTSSVVVSPVRSPSPTGPLTTGPNVRPGEKPPTLPPLAQRHSRLGATTFAVYYFKAFDWSIATNDAYLIRQIGLKSCSACTRIETFLSELHRKREVLLGGRMHITSFGVVHGKFRFPSDVVVRVRLTQDAETRKSASVAASTVATAAPNVSLVFLNWTSAGWKVVEVAQP